LTGLEIRTYRPEDRDELLGVWERANRIGHPFFDEAELAARRHRLIEIYLPMSETWVAWDAGRIVGGIGLENAFVGGLFVEPTHHGRGIGRRLLAHATALEGPLTLHVYIANTGARAFYDRCGFLPLERRERDDDGRPWPVVVMTGPTRP
jgi:putative acetyltransferase